MKSFVVVFALSASILGAQDVVTLRNGVKRTGKIAGLDAAMLKIQVPLPVESEIRTATVFASVSIPRIDIVSIEFAPDPAIEALLKARSLSRPAELQTAWVTAEPWLGIQKSNAARIGNALAQSLLASGVPSDAAKALEIFRQIESDAWSPEDQMTAKEGRLRALVATGRAGEAVKEAEQIAALTEDPAILMEAKYILAEAAGASLKKLLGDNPRWEEDLNVIPERNRLYHEAVDLCLYPALFGGADADTAARGLWSAVGIYQLVGESPNALECARDIAAIYPGTKYAAFAKDFVASLPANLTSVDPEKEAKEENFSSSKRSENDEKPENPTGSNPRKRSHETPKPKKS